MPLQIVFLRTTYRVVSRCWFTLTLIPFRILKPVIWYLQELRNLLESFRRFTMYSQLLIPIVCRTMRLLLQIQNNPRWRDRTLKLQTSFYKLAANAVKSFFQWPKQGNGFTQNICKFYTIYDIPYIQTQLKKRKKISNSYNSFYSPITFP